ncbi:MAG: O-antigen polymerase [Bacteroidota bacterium]
MSLISLFCFIVFGIVVVASFRRGNDLFSPTRVFVAVWATAIGFADLKLSKLQHDWQPYAWITIVIALSSFLLGIYSVRIIHQGRAMLSIKEIRERMGKLEIREHRLRGIIFFLSISYFLVYIIEWWYRGGLPLFAAYPDMARTLFPIFGIHLFVGAMPIILFLISEYLLFAQITLARKLLLWLIFFSIVLSYFFLLNRLYIVYYLILLLGFFYYSTNYVKLRYVVVVMVFGIGFLALLQYYREVRYAENFLYVVSGMRYAPQFAVLTGPYMYIVMNLENFAHAVVRLEHHTFGYFTFDFLMAISGLKHWLASYFNLNERAFLISGFNTFPFFWDYYYDYGIAGMAILSGLLGFIIELIHQMVRRRPTLINLSLYSVAIFVIVISFFTTPLTSLNFDFNIMLLLLTQIAITPKGNLDNETRPSIAMLNG